MANDDSTVLPFKADRTPSAGSKELDLLTNTLKRDINLVKCQLHCATWALGEAQSRDDTELAAQSWTAINACVESLGDIEEKFDQLCLKLTKAGVRHG